MVKVKSKTRFFLFVGCIYFLAHLYIMSDTQNIFYAATSDFDKAEHFISGFVLAGIVASALNYKASGYISFFTVLALGTLFEMVELHTPYGGFPDGYLDIMYNQMGAAFGIFASDVN